MDAATILALANALPGLIQLITNARAGLSATDQAAVDAAISSAKTAALTHEAEAETALDTAAGNGS
jgi:hypothetical protein